MTRKRKGPRESDSGPKSSSKTTLAISKAREISISSMQETLTPFGVALTPALADSLRKYLALLLRWNQKINLTASSDSGEILSRHVGESLFGVRFLPDSPGTLYDVGSGAGFPGLMLKIARPEWEAVLVESDHRKAAFLSEAVRVLGLESVRVVADRFDRLPLAESIADIITARALGEYPNLLKWSRGVLGPSGSVLLWLGLQDASLLSQTAGWRWETAVRIPGSEGRVVLRGVVES